jgi:hypothetical protein
VPRVPTSASRLLFNRSCHVVVPYLAATCSKVCPLVTMWALHFGLRPSHTPALEVKDPEGQGTVLATL